MVQIKSSDNKLIEIDNKLAHQSILLTHILSSTKLIEPIMLPISSDILEIVIEYMKHLKVPFTMEPRFSQEDASYVSSIPDHKLVPLASAANYLNFPSLLAICCKILAERMKNKNMAELRELVGVSNDLNEKDRNELNEDFGWISSSNEEY
ncbi:SKP1-like protein 5 [Astathelohania contejeani]|uniref:E3 ubiquitin ligase complex SCF subunit n=1 Tax=Astathelohania contejeani TaxID=164912 RepID=A0ABQ7I2E4_9MICR|nr:SKP1-like protein 5 [Thelohania contejeani]